MALASYDVAQARFAELLNSDPPDVHPEYRTRLFDQGSRVTHCVVLIHGLTNCPRQFDIFGEILYEYGCNVLVPRMPRHGFNNRMTTELAGLTRAELLDYLDSWLAVAAGLGEQITVAGISAGGLLAAWCAQYRADVTHAIPIAPSFAPIHIDVWRTALLEMVGTLLPNWYIWWSSELRTAIKPAHAYPRYPTRAMAVTLRLGRQIRLAARRTPARAAYVTMVTTDHDNSVNNAVNTALLRHWQQRIGARARELVLHGLPHIHDIIDPGQPLERTELVYPALRKLILEPLELPPLSVRV